MDPYEEAQEIILRDVQRHVKKLERLMTMHDLYQVIDTRRAANLIEGLKSLSISPPPNRKAL